MSFDYPTTLNQALYKSTLEGELEDLLRYADRNSMAHSREVRLPFLSHPLVEFMFSLPENFKLRNGVTKFLMRESLGDLLPPAITGRMDKIGYEPPQNKWLASTDILEKIAAARKNLIAAGFLDKNVNGNFNDPATAWKLLMTNLLV